MLRYKINSHDDGRHIDYLCMCVGDQLTECTGLRLPVDVNSKELMYPGIRNVRLDPSMGNPFPTSRSAGTSSYKYMAVYSRMGYTSHYGRLCAPAEVARPKTVQPNAGSGDLIGVGRWEESRRGSLLS